MYIWVFVRNKYTLFREAFTIRGFSKHICICRNVPVYVLDVCCSSCCYEIWYNDVLLIKIISMYQPSRGSLNLYWIKLWIVWIWSRLNFQYCYHAVSINSHQLISIDWANNCLLKSPLQYWSLFLPSIEGYLWNAGLSGQGVGPEIMGSEVWFPQRLSCKSLGQAF